MDDEMISRLVLLGFALAGLIAIVIYVLRDVFKACMRGNRVAPADTQQEPVSEMPFPPYDEVLNEPTVICYLPTYEEATSLPRRRRISPKDNVTSSIDGRDETGTQSVSGEAAGERNNGGNGGEYSGTSALDTSTRNDSGVRLNFVYDNDMNASSADGGSTVNDSGIKFGSEDKNDRVDADSMSKYDTASEASGGSFRGRDSNSPLPWSSF